MFRVPLVIASMVCAVVVALSLGGAASAEQAGGTQLGILGTPAGSPS